MQKQKCVLERSLKKLLLYWYKLRVDFCCLIVPVTLFHPKVALITYQS